MKRDERLNEVLSALVRGNEAALGAILSDVSSDAISYALHRLEDSGYRDAAEALKDVVYNRTR